MTATEMRVRLIAELKACMSDFPFPSMNPADGELINRWWGGLLEAHITSDLCETLAAVDFQDFADMWNREMLRIIHEIETELHQTMEAPSVSVDGVQYIDMGKFRQWLQHPGRAGLTQ